MKENARYVKMDRLNSNNGAWLMVVVILMGVLLWLMVSIIPSKESDYNQAMSQLASCKCQEMQYETEVPMSECPYAETCIQYRHRKKCWRTKCIEIHNFITGRFLPDENKIECYDLSKAYFRELSGQKIYINTLKDLYWNGEKWWIQIGYGTAKTYDIKSQKFTLSEVGLG